MKLLAVTVVALLIALGAAQTPTTKPTTVVPTTKPTTATPTTKPTTAAPTTKPTTAAPTTKPTTAAPTTKPTTAAPTTKPTTAAPTTKPTTAAPTTKPTTAAPTTKPTTAAPTTKPTTAVPTTKPTTAAPTTNPAAPTTLPPNFYTVTDGAGNKCILAQFFATFSGQYELKNNTKKDFMFTLPENADVDQINSHCGNATKSAVMVLTFDDKGDSLLLEFTMDSKTKTFQLVTANISLMHSEAHFPNSNQSGQVVSYGGALPKAAFTTSLGSYYKCAAEETLNFKSQDFAVLFTDLKLQPFDVDKTFGKLSQCAADTPNIIPAEPPIGNWTISNKQGVCMRMEFGIDFIINYTRSNGTVSQAGFNMPNTTDVVDTGKSSCDNGTATLVASFSPDKLKPTETWVLTMNFTMDKENDYAMTNFSLMYDLDATRFPDVNATKTVTATNNTKRFSTVSGYYYLCNADQLFNADSVQVKLTKVKLQPFAQKVENKGYGSASDCAADNTISNIVPIAVGCALAGLVIIVLIAYLIGRSRSNRSGYQSV